ncbi:MAG: OmpA family protein [Maritimibacter sp.]
MTMTSTKRLLAATSMLALVAACSPESVSREAGGYLDEGAFGNATMNNTLIQNGERSYVVDLAGRFNQEVADTVTFGFNSAVLDAEARAVLSRQASWIRQFPEVRFRVYGHTDLVGSSSYNQSLGRQRANAVVAYLATQGISRSRLEALVSYGETRPVVNTSDRERQNRRTVTEVSGFVQDNPLILDGKYAEVVYRNYVEESALPTKESGETGGLAALMQAAQGG